MNNCPCCVRNIDPVICPECRELLELGKAVMGMGEGSELCRTDDPTSKAWAIYYVENGICQFAGRDTPIEALKAANK